MKKKSLLFLMMLFLVTKLFAYDGVFSGAKNVFTVTTKWFDVIYEEGSEQTAKIISENADALFEEVCKDYSTEPYFRMPIVITSRVESFNAYWSNTPYNHIVVYDTSCIEDLAVFSETLLSVLKHELTHAVTYNLSSPFWRFTKKVFGDPFSLNGVAISSGFAEGATVAQESANGEGRLNSEYALQTVKQAKIENSFPSFNDVKGSSEVFPYDNYYMFNGAFAGWLQKEYGMEKYAQWWYRILNLKSFFQSTAFEKVYGISLNNAWGMFFNSINVPDVKANPLDQYKYTESSEWGILDFFDGRTEVSGKNKKSNFYASLTASKKGLAYIDYNAVYYVDSVKFGDKKLKAKKLFELRGLDSIKLSQDGRYLAVSYYTLNSSTIKQKVMIYNMETKSMFTVKGTNLTDASIIQDDENYYLVASSYGKTKYSIKLFLIEENEAKTKITSVKEYSSYDVVSESGKEIIVDSYTDLGNGEFAYIKKEGLQYSVCVRGVGSVELQEFKAPEEGMVIRYLSKDYTNNNENTLLFSWTKKGTLPRFGKLKLNGENAEYCLFENDISGGVYYPVGIAYNSSYNPDGDYFYFGQFYRKTNLYKLIDSTKDSKIYKNYSVKNTVTKSAGLELNKNEELTAQMLGAKKYNPFSYFGKGYWTPFAGITCSDFIVLPFGVTYITSNPWGTDYFALSAATDFSFQALDFTYGFSAEYNSGTDTDLFSYDIYSDVTFTKKGFKNTEGQIALSNNYNFRNYNRISLFDRVNVFYGKKSIYEEKPEENGLVYYSYVIHDDKFDFDWMNSFGIQYSNIHNTNQTRYDKKGFSLSVEGIYGNGQKDIALSSEIYIPKLIPIENNYGYTYNLPTKISLNFGKQNQEYLSTYYALYFRNFSDVLGLDENTSINVETILFAKQIQKSIPFIYFNDFYISIEGYCGLDILPDKDWKLFHLGEFFSDTENVFSNCNWFGMLNFRLGITPNMGGAASSSNKSYIGVSLIPSDLYGSFILYPILTVNLQL